MKLSKSVLMLPVSCLLLLPACRRPKAEAPDLTAFPVRVEKARRRALEETVTVTGTVKARDEAILYSRVPGKLLDYPAKEGAAVRKGEAVARVERDEVGVVYKPAPVTSPLDGVVARTYLDKGAQVKTDTPVALVIDPSEMRVRAEVPERYAGRIRAGQSARVSPGSSEDKSVVGRVTLVSPSIDAATRSFPIEIRLAERRGLTSGMFADATIIVKETTDALTVPPSAVVGEDDGAPAVFVVSDGKAVRRPVALGGRTTDAVEIRSGVSPGEDVVTFGLFALQDGSPVRVLTTEAPVPQ